MLVLSGGPGCAHYLEQDAIAPVGHRAWFPEPRGLGRSGGGPHDMERAVADLEAVRSAAGVASWVVVGRSWGCEPAVRYAVEHPESVVAVVGIAGRGPQRDRTWSEVHEAGKPGEPVVEIAWVPEVHAALGASFTAWIQEESLWRGLADCEVPMAFATVPDVPHDFWSTHSEVWTRTVSELCAAVTGR